MRRVLALDAPARKADAVQLTERDKAILDFERSWWTEPGSKDSVIADRFELATSRYYEILNELIESVEAEIYDPLVVRRLRRMRDRRTRARLDGVAVAKQEPGL